MIPKKRQRRIYQWKVEFRAFPSEAAKSGKTTSLDEYVGVLEAELGRGRARWYLGSESKPLDVGDASQDEKNQIYIAEIRRENPKGYIAILFNRGDPSASNPVFLNPVSNQTRESKADPAESLGWSAHLLIATTQTDGKHKACLEQMHHVPSDLLMNALDRIVTRALENNPHYTYEKTISKKIEHRDYRPRMDVYKVPSVDLLQDIKDGTLSKISLVKKIPKYQGPGAEDMIKRQNQQVVISVSPEKDKGKVQALVNGIINYAKQNEFESIHFKVDDLPGGGTGTPSINVDSGNAFDQLYVRSLVIDGFTNDLLQCYTEICDPIVDRMVAIIENAGKWK
ncbi:hypothetical protein [Asticcacaulis sp. AND118]|uniref:hypothetical protein n=1 Tax=Asticcacaulis sp. AND118 TaxID=2840468 RepID=UPI001CFF7173|nr:hypothetical protein [Asticcacaulis sp. AND118]UDF05216.1 hypothetical protein LH365_17655 [Asticcacaulis sp. AND118]